MCANNTSVRIVRHNILTGRLRRRAKRQTERTHDLETGAAHALCELIVANTGH